MDKTKILFVDHTPFIGGAQIWLATQLKLLNRKKFQPGLIVSREAEISGLYNKSKVPIFRIHFEKLKSLNPKSLFRLKESLKQYSLLINKLKPDIIVANTTRALVLTALGKKDHQLVSYILDYDYPKWLIKLLKSKVDKFLFVSKSIKNFYGLDGEVVYLGTGVKIKNFKLKISNYKKKLGIKRGEIVVGFVGRLVEWKGADILIDAIAKINHPKVKLLIFGTGEEEKNLKLKIVSKETAFGRANLKLEDKVQLMGFMQDRALIYSSLDIFVLPSQKPEPFATSSLDAAACGLPIIATKTGGTPEFIKNGKNGLLVKPQSSTSLAHALVRLIKDKKLRVRLGKQALKDTALFDDKKVVKNLERIYLESSFSA